LLSQCGFAAGFAQELLQGFVAEASGLLVHEGADGLAVAKVHRDGGQLLQALCLTGLQGLFDFGVRHGEAELLGLVAHDGVLLKFLPDGLANLVLLLLRERGIAAREARQIAASLHGRLEVLDVETLALHLANRLAVHVEERLNGFKKRFGHKGEQAETDDGDEPCAAASDFLKYCHFLCF